MTSVHGEALSHPYETTASYRVKREQGFHAARRIQGSADGVSIDLRRAHLLRRRLYPTAHPAVLTNRIVDEFPARGLYNPQLSQWIPEPGAQARNDW